MSGFETIAELGPSRPLRMGVLGASRIVKQALLDCADGLVSVNAIAARDLGRAQKFAAEHGIARAYGSYEELISAPDLDAVYVALPASAHAKYAQSALRAGKHVLCEKPFAVCAEEASQCLEASQSFHRLLMEAHHWRYHPLVPVAAEKIAALGPVESLEATFRVGLNNPGDIRLNPKLGGGVLMDFGCYLIQWVRWSAEVAGVSLGEERRVLDVSVVEGPAAVDVAASVRLNWAGVPVAMDCDMRDGTPFEARIVVHGASHSLCFENPLAVGGSSIRVTERGAGVLEEEIGPEPEAESTYRRQLRSFCDALRTGHYPPTSGPVIWATQSALDDLYRAAGLPARSELRGSGRGA